jgi:hypothetical protein
MSKLTQATHVLVTRTLGNYYLTRERAETLISILEGPSAPKKIKVDDSHIFVSDIVGVTTAAKINEVAREKKGEWKCQAGNWHAKFEDCKCGWGMTNLKPSHPKDKELSSEEKERNKKIAKLIKKGYKFRDLPKLKDKTLAELDKILSFY